MSNRRPFERRVTADDLPNRDMWYDPEELDPYMDARDAETARLREALDEMITALRIQARLALYFGGGVAMHEGNADAWDKAKKALANRTITPEVDHE